MSGGPCTPHCRRRATRLVTVPGWGGAYVLGYCVEHAVSIRLPVPPLPESLVSEFLPVTLTTLRTWDVPGSPISCVTDRGMYRRVPVRKTSMTRGRC